MPLSHLSHYNNYTEIDNVIVRARRTCHTKKYFRCQINSVVRDITRPRSADHVSAYLAWRCTAAKRTSCVDTTYMRSDLKLIYTTRILCAAFIRNISERTEIVGTPTCIQEAILWCARPTSHVRPNTRNLFMLRHTILWQQRREPRNKLRLPDRSSAHVMCCLPTCSWIRSYVACTNYVTLLVCSVVGRMCATI